MFLVSNFKGSRTAIEQDQAVLFNQTSSHLADCGFGIRPCLVLRHCFGRFGPNRSTVVRSISNPGSNQSIEVASNAVWPDAEKRAGILHSDFTVGSQRL
jgi:hypothetical protein